MAAYDFVVWSWTRAWDSDSLHGEDRRMNWFPSFERRTTELFVNRNSGSRFRKRAKMVATGLVRLLGNLFRPKVVGIRSGRECSRSRATGRRWYTRDLTSPVASRKKRAFAGSSGERRWCVACSFAVSCVASDRETSGFRTLFKMVRSDRGPRQSIAATLCTELGLERRERHG